jgi:hypothetical protein
VDRFEVCLDGRTRAPRLRCARRALDPHRCRLPLDGPGATATSGAGCKTPTKAWSVISTANSTPGEASAATY